jgi:signal transduction histidine kinase
LKKADVCEIVRRICVEFYEDITETGKDFDIDIPEESFYSEVDVQLFGRVINNLLANANKYNSTGKNICVSVKKDADQIVVEVADDGEAIAEEFVPRLFEAFSRGDSTRKTDGGTGLGLAIAHKIIEKHKGTLNYVRAEEKNIFIIRIL